jgi:fumarate reductase flavoprotein subunit
MNIRQVIDAALQNGSTEVLTADSVEELAEKMGVDPAVFKATVDEYNHFCEKGRDDLFAKNPRYLVPLKGPRYYATKCYTVCLGTKGGIKINEKMEVVDKKDNPIQGLYAGGLEAGGLYGDSYPIFPSSGLASGFALNSGRIAGRNAAGYIKECK